MKLHLQGRQGGLSQSSYFEVLGELQGRYPLVLGDNLLVAVGAVCLKAAFPLSGSSRLRTRSGR